MKYFDKKTQTVVQIKTNTNDYFEKLFIRLANKKDDMGCSVISFGDGELWSPTDLKDYLITTLRSIVQYDFGIRYTEKDALDFAKALTNERKKKSVKNERKQLNKKLEEIEDYISGQDW